MDTGQIFQGLRADTMQQQMQGQSAGQGQTAGSGVSFGDILLMLAAGSQGMAAPGMINMQQMMHTAPMSGFGTVPGAQVMMPGAEGMQEGLMAENDALIADDGTVLSEIGGKAPVNIPIFGGMDLQSGMVNQADGNIPDALSHPKGSMENDALVQFMQGRASLEDENVRKQLNELIKYMSGDRSAEETASLALVQDTENVSQQAIASDESVKAQAEETNVSEDAGKSEEILTDKAAEKDDSLKAQVTEGEKSSVSDKALNEADEVTDNTDKAQKTSEKDNAETTPAENKPKHGHLDITEGRRAVIKHEEKPLNKTESAYGKEPVGEGKKENEDILLSYVTDDKVTKENFGKRTAAINNAKSDGDVRTFDYKRAPQEASQWFDESEGIPVYNPQALAQLEKIFKGIDPRLKSAEGIVPRKLQMADMQAIPHVLFKTGKPELSELAAPSETPETKGISKGQKFVIDLLGSISKNDRELDSFDFSENIIKADPMQLAGLLEYVRTGIGIPLLSDVADRDAFRNINTVGSISAEKIFDPADMIKSGEMEIISYTPARQTEDNKGGEKSFSDEQSRQDNAKETIGHARTMRDVRETVKPFTSRLNPHYDDEDTDISADNKITPENMHDIIRRVDISFDRALAELEMNKAEYGTPDKQAAQQITQNLLRGRSEFTVKLRPEGLGEILVKLVSDEGGKTILSLAASSQRTADLLNKDLAALQSQLGNHNVEIENNSVRVQETVMPADHQSDAAFNQFDQRRRDEGEQENRYREVRKKLNTDDTRVGSTEFDSDIEVGKNAVNDSMLNISI